MKLRWSALRTVVVGVSLATPAAAHATWFVEAANLAIENPRTDAFGDPLDSVRKKGGEAVAVFDVNSDGIQDFVVANGTTYYHVVLGGRGPSGEPTFMPLAPVYIGELGDQKNNISKGLGLHDLNGDGLLDLYLGTTGKGTLQARNRRDLENILDPANLIEAGLYRHGGFRVQLNRGDGSFQHAELGIEPGGNTRSGVFADFDGDGSFDLLDSNAPYFGIWWNGSPLPNRLLAGRPGGTFAEDVLPQAVVNDPGDLFFDVLGRANKDFKGVVVRDFDRDGRPDIVMSAYADVWDNVAIPPLAPADPAGALVDLDGDQLADGGYQGDWERGILVLRNVSSPGEIAFENVSEAAIDQPLGGPDRMHVYVTVPADIDADADLDLLVSGPRNYTAHGSLAARTPMIAVYRNDSTPGSIRFTNVSQESGIAFLNDDEALSVATRGLYPVVIPGLMLDGGAFEMRPLLSSAAALDIDNDGDPDWVGIDRQFLPANPLTGEKFTLWAFENDGGGRFSLVPPSQHGMQNTARDISYGDLDGDGRVDLVAVNGSGGGQFVEDANYVYLNRVESDHHYIFVNAMSPGSRQGIGTTVTVYAAGTKRILGYDEVRTDFAYRSKRSTRLHFGVGDADAVDVRLERRSGSEKIWLDLDVDREYRFAEVSLDLHPESQRNRVAPRSRRLVRIAILGAPGLDAETIDADSLAFGPGRAPARGVARLKDVNRDGLDDLLLRFRLSDSGIGDGDEQLCVEGRTVDGMLLDGCDVLTLVGVSARSLAPRLRLGDPSGL